MAEIELKPVRPEEAIAYLEARGARPFESFDWRDVDASMHATGFTVAKGMQVDIVRDIYEALQANRAAGFDAFKKSVMPSLQAKGWWGKAEMTDPVTGETRLVQLGSERRLRTIFDTNIRTAHAVGRWQQIQRLKAARPWLRYVAVLDDRTRPLHRHWHNTVLLVDDAWWETHYPPNGWNCRCSVMQLSDRDLLRYGLAPSPKAPDDGNRVWVNPRITDQDGNPERLVVPKGIDPGFGHNAGIVAEREHGARLLYEKIASLPPAEAVAAAQASAPVALPAMTRDFGRWVDQLAAGMQQRGERRVIGVLDQALTRALPSVSPATLENAAVTIGDDRVLHALRASKAAAGKTLPVDALRDLPTAVASGDAYWDSRNGGNLVFVAPDVRPGWFRKFIFALGHVRKGRDQDGARRTVPSVAFLSAGYEQSTLLQDPATYTRLR